MEKVSLYLLTLTMLGLVLSGMELRQPARADESIDDSSRPHLQIINGSQFEVEVFWLASPGERTPVAKIAASSSDNLSTTLGHRFLVIGQNDSGQAHEIQVESRVLIQATRFDPHSPSGVPSLYTQSADTGGFPIVADSTVNHYAVLEAKYLISQMLAQRPDVLQALTDSGARMCILGYQQFTTELPEFAWLGNSPVGDFPQLNPRDYWDARARGTGGSQTDPFCSCGEENLLCYPGDPYAAECILIHEFAHCVHLRGMSNLDPTFDRRLHETYDAAMQAGLWKGKYASVNHHEYFAEGVQSWFDNNRENDFDHNHVNTRAELQEYDPQLASLCEEVFGVPQFVYTRPTTRLKDHMAGYTPEKAPTFRWPQRLQQTQKTIREAAEKRSEGGE